MGLASAKAPEPVPHDKVACVFKALVACHQP
jgi:hypothetical protein